MVDLTLEEVCPKPYFCDRGNLEIKKSFFQCSRSFSNFNKSYLRFLLCSIESSSARLLRCFSHAGGCNLMAPPFLTHQWFGQTETLVIYPPPLASVNFLKSGQHDQYLLREQWTKALSNNFLEHSLGYLQVSVGLIQGDQQLDWKEVWCEPWSNKNKNLLLDLLKRCCECISHFSWHHLQSVVVKWKRPHGFKSFFSDNRVIVRANFAPQKLKGFQDKSLVILGR